MQTYASLSQAGVQPLIKKRGPSVRKDSVMIFMTLCDVRQLCIAVVSSGKYASIPVSLHQLPLRFVLDSLTRRQVRRRWWPLFLLKEKRGSGQAYHLLARRWIRVVAWLRNSCVIQSDCLSTRLVKESAYVAICDTSALCQTTRGSDERREKDLAWSIGPIEAQQWRRKGHQLTHDDTANDVRT